ncbi:nuclear transport factor 2 family protein [Aquimarina sp. U1-2]|uniref:nuclear transport factor 2 family protein n=1 Tax=Aquimarina sp. U1-2 TaxID=2823141 RepID=UPI001AEC8BB8|nr:nuclear transport factor 2 family protein [Aquimarina sp. U1-2]MBP2834107.1 nuclear transport factor 2 family protein [Aquimarina sp. U1-2]
MRKYIIYVLLLSLSFGYTQEETKIDTILTKWHKAAANADFKTYFDLMTNDAIFIGTDPTENWQYDAFKTFAKPYFDKGKAWSFTTLERHIFLDHSKKVAWFDELLDTQMGICRGSGVVQKTTKGWKIQHYVLSITIPNENVKEIMALKKKFDLDLIKKLNTARD